MVKIAKDAPRKKKTFHSFGDKVKNTRGRLLSLHSSVKGEGGAESMYHGTASGHTPERGY